MIPHGGPNSTPNPHPDEPGTLGQMLVAVNVAFYLGQRRGTTARDEWDDARRLCIPHARPRDGEGQP